MTHLFQATTVWWPAKIKLTYWRQILEIFEIIWKKNSKKKIEISLKVHAIQGANFLDKIFKWDIFIVTSLSHPCHESHDYVTTMSQLCQKIFLWKFCFWCVTFSGHFHFINNELIWIASMRIFLFANLPRYHYKTVASTFHNIVTSFQDYCHICNIFTHRHIGNILRYISSTLSSMYSVSKRFSKCTNPYWKPNPKRAIITSEVVLDFISRNHYNMYIKISIVIFRFFEGPL